MAAPTVRRGRPAQNMSPATRQARDKDLNARRVRQWRFHQKAQATTSSDAQRTQRDGILRQASKSASPSPTPLTLGLRVGDLNLAGDPRQELAGDDGETVDTHHRSPSVSSRSSAGESFEPPAAPPLNVRGPFDSSPVPSSRDSDDDDEFYDSLTELPPLNSPCAPDRQRSPKQGGATFTPLHTRETTSPTPPQTDSLVDCVSVGCPPSPHVDQPTSLPNSYLKPFQGFRTLERSGPALPSLRVPAQTPPPKRLSRDPSVEDRREKRRRLDSSEVPPQQSPEDTSGSPAQPVGSASTGSSDESDREETSSRHHPDVSPSPGRPASSIQTAGVVEDSDYLPSSPLDALDLNDFPSDPPAPDSPDPDDDPHRVETAKKVIKLLTAFPGCSRSNHDTLRRQHLTEHPGAHTGLEAIWDHPLRRREVLQEESLMEDEANPPSLPDPGELRQMITGIRPGSTTPPTICLHANEPEPSPVDVSFDCDSFLGFASSLAFARGGINFTPYPSATRNVKSDLHMTNQRPVEGSDPDVPPPTFDVRDTAHYRFGSVEDVPDLSVFIIFPHLTAPRNANQGLSDAQLTVWMDQAVFPAINRACPADVVEKLPGSLEAAKLSASAPHVETRATYGAGYRAKAAITHYLGNGHLGAVWEEINEAISDPDCGDLRPYRDCQVFFSAKGVKQKHRTREGSLFDCLGGFQAWLTDILDLEYVFEDYLYVDIGKETGCPYHHATSEAATEGQEPQAFFFRSCCVQSYVEAMYGTEDRGSHTYYTPALLGQISNLTSVPSKGSSLAHGGVLYVQLYGSWKNIFDAIKVYPFASTGLEELALDPDIRQAAASVSRSTFHDIKPVKDAYRHCKARTNRVVQDAQSKSWSVREEIRVAWRTISLMQTRLAPQCQGAICGALPQPQSHLYRLGSPTFCKFLWHNANKFAYLFELIRCRYRRQRVPWGATGLMVMALRLLEHCVSASHLSRETALVYDRRENLATGQYWQGLGFGSALEDYGYCWPKDLVRWDRLRWKGRYEGQILIGNQVLRKKYSTYAGQRGVRKLLEDSRSIERLVGWLVRTGVQEQQERILITIAHIVLRRLRFDLLSEEPRMPLPNRQTIDSPRLIQDNKVFLCHDSIREIYGQKVAISGSNRSTFKTPEAIATFLFGRNDGIEQAKSRRHIEAKPYRTLFFEAGDQIERRDTSCANPSHRWISLFYRQLVSYHWLYPVPDVAAGTLSTRTEKRASQAWQGHTQVRWWAIRRRQGRPQAGDLHGWGWGGSRQGQNYEEGSPPPYPAELSWKASDWQAYLATPAPAFGGSDVASDFADSE